MNKKTIYIALLFLFTFSGKAFAYLDPGTGSMLIQGLIGAIAAGYFVIKTYWNKIIDLINKIRGKNDTE
jgi:hypothetical protein